MRVVERRIVRIVSGGQTGADQGALDAALELGFPCGGWCPRGRRAENGTIPERYPLRELTRTNYLVRTERNVIDSDATLVLTFGAPTSGSRATIDFAVRHRRPWYHADLDRGSDAQLAAGIGEWLAGTGTGLVLNVAGSRESTSRGIRDRVHGLVLLLLRNDAPSDSA